MFNFLKNEDQVACVPLPADREMERRLGDFHSECYRRYHPEAMKHVTPNDIKRLAARDEIVHACLAMWGHGDVTWEEALLMMVKYQADQRQALQDELTRVLQTLPPARASGGGPE